MPYCSNCGSAYDEGNKFCQKCGYKIDSAKITVQGPRTEQWIGEYTYKGLTGFFRRPVSFSAVLIFDGDRLSGNIKEHNTFTAIDGHGRPEYMYATIDGYIRDDRVEFHKRYDGAGGYGQTVYYQGTLDANAGKISGESRLHFASGEFKMSRVV